VKDDPAAGSEARSGTKSSLVALGGIIKLYPIMVLFIAPNAIDEDAAHGWKAPAAPLLEESSSCAGMLTITFALAKTSRTWDSPYLRLGCQTFSGEGVRVGVRWRFSL